jgi:hypothetical protein
MFSKEKYLLCYIFERLHQYISLLSKKFQKVSFSRDICTFTDNLMFFKLNPCALFSSREVLVRLSRYFVVIHRTRISKDVHVVVESGSTPTLLLANVGKAFTYLPNCEKEYSDRGKGGSHSDF